MIFKFFTKRWVSRKEYDERVQKCHDFIKQQEKSFESQISLLENDYKKRMEEQIEYYEKLLTEEHLDTGILQRKFNEAQANFNAAKKELKEANFALVTLENKLMDEIKGLKQKLTIVKARNTRLKNKLEKVERALLEKVEEKRNE